MSEYNNPSPEPTQRLQYEDFDTTPQKISDYKLGDSVTRENWIPFVILSFSKSRGDAEAQAIWLEYASAKSNFNWRKSLDSFLAHKLDNSLSDDEQELVKKSFRKVNTPGHTEIADIDVFEEFTNNLNELLVNYHDDSPFEDMTQEQIKLMPLEEVQDMINAEITAFRDRLRAKETSDADESE